jgi:hypothetical protein
MGSPWQDDATLERLGGALHLFPARRSPPAATSTTPPLRTRAERIGDALTLDCSQR